MNILYLLIQPIEDFLQKNLWYLMKSRDIETHNKHLLWEQILIDLSCC